MSLEVCIFHTPEQCSWINLTFPCRPGLSVCTCQTCACKHRDVLILLSESDPRYLAQEASTWFAGDIVLGNKILMHVVIL